MHAAISAAMLNRLKDDRALLRAYTRRDEEPDFVIQICMKCFAYMENEIDQLRKKNLSKNTLKMVSSFVTGGSAAVIRSWLMHGCREKEETVADMILALSGTLIRELEI